METKKIIKNLFLTGPRNIGKSTILRKVLNDCSGEPVNGFVTEDEFDETGTQAGFQIRAFNEKSGHTFAVRNFKTRQPRFWVDTSILNKFGKLLLEEILPAASIIVMDEIGWMEKDALQFQEAVLKCIDSSKVVVGVLKEKEGILLNTIRARKDVEIFTVNLDNREQLVGQVLSRINRAINFNFLTKHDIYLHNS